MVDDDRLKITVLHDYRVSANYCSVAGSERR